LSRHYLDHASTSPPRPEVVAAMTDWLARAGAGEVGDPGRIHAEGLAARYEIETARQAVADLLGARSREVVFTSGATEAVATAVWGAAGSGRTHVVVPAVEHSAVRLAVQALVDAGTHRQTLVGVDATGRLRVDDVVAAIGDDTALVCVQWANHEVGTVQPVAEIVAAGRHRGALTLVDAASAAGHVPIDFRALGADLLAVSAHKLGGPTGVGALLVRRGLRLEPLLRGGDQERARRAGLEHALGIVGFGAACTALAAPAGGGDGDAGGDGGARGDRLAREAAEARRRTDRVRALAGGGSGIRLFGPPEPDRRLPHLVCLGIDGVEPQPVLLGLDRVGIAVHSGSSCSSESLEPSPVLEAMGVDAHRSLRVSVGWSTTDDDIDALVTALPAVLGDLRALATG
jgi:cysteine desulfurase